jgi:hypothetical protein
MEPVPQERKPNSRSTIPNRQNSRCENQYHKKGNLIRGQQYQIDKTLDVHHFQRHFLLSLSTPNLCVFSGNSTRVFSSTKTNEFKHPKNHVFF